MLGLPTQSVSNDSGGGGGGAERATGDDRGCFGVALE